jgi:hypothetical protein
MTAAKRKGEFKPCPWCGGKNIDVVGYMIGYRYQSKCSCGVCGPIIKLLNKNQYIDDDIENIARDLAIKAWNHRAEVKP